MIDWRLGTMGFGYSDWAGVFYPRGMRSAEYLSFYARHFNAVELDTTFHAAPDGGRVRKWADAVPAGFRFSAKTPKSITHETAIDRSIDAMCSFVDVMRELGDKLGVILVQFAPSFTFEQLPRLRTFLSALPSDVRFAVELRNRSWGRNETLELLREYGCALVMAEYLSRPRRIHVTSDLLYVRLIGQHDRFTKTDREQIDASESLAWWHGEIARVEPRVGSTWCLFSNDFAGYAIATCNRFKQLAGLPASAPGKHDLGELF